MRLAQDNTIEVASATQHRFHSLDAMRGLAALMVVAYHAPADFGRIVPFRSGFLAVDLFFVLSGFVIAFSYDRRLHEGMSYRNFVVARLIRLYPVYLFVTVLSVFLALATTRTLSPQLVPQIVLALLMLPDVFHGAAAAVYPVDYPAWSLLCELFANVGYVGLFFWKFAGRWLLYLIVVASAAYMVVWTRQSGTIDSGSVLRTLPMGLARVGYSFGAGVVVFRYFHRKPRQRLAGLSSGLLTSALCLVIFCILATRVAHSPAAQLWAVLVVFPCLIYLGALTTMTGMPSKAAAFLGDISYPIYLLHIPFFTFFRGRSMHRVALNYPHSTPPIALLSFCLLLAFSWAVARWLDLPVRRSLAASYNRWASHAA